jgi:cytochrome c biogenesis factor
MLRKKYFHQKLFRALSSLKLAVLVIFLLAVALAVATILESIYDTPTAQYWVYRSDWFHLLLGLLGLNIFCVATSRFPWKKRHIPFLLAHAGILILLVGSWITEKFGLDGNLRITEGETASVVELDSASLYVNHADRLQLIPIPWLPPGLKFRGIDAVQAGLAYDFRIDQFLSHADPIV